jgi:hypothetical protein
MCECHRANVMHRSNSLTVSFDSFERLLARRHRKEVLKGTNTARLCRALFNTSLMALFAEAMVWELDNDKAGHNWLRPFSGGADRVELIAFIGGAADCACVTATDGSPDITLRPSVNTPVSSVQDALVTACKQGQVSP